MSIAVQERPSVVGYRERAIGMPVRRARVAERVRPAGTPHPYGEPGALVSRAGSCEATDAPRPQPSFAVTIAAGLLAALVVIGLLGIARWRTPEFAPGSGAGSVVQVHDAASAGPVGRAGS